MMCEGPVGYSPRAVKESDTTEQFHFLVSLLEDRSTRTSGVLLVAQCIFILNSPVPMSLAYCWALMSQAYVPLKQDPW